MSKILNIRENEKDIAQRSYQESVNFFEEKATQLYELLREKETAEALYEKSIQESLSIEKIKDHALYTDALDSQILTIQEQVNQARHQMDKRQAKLTGAHVEVKKFEKIIELREDKARAIEEKEDQMIMDEVSTQQYLKQNTGEYNG